MITGCYQGLQGLRGVTKGYRVLRELLGVTGVKWSYRAFQGVTGGYKGLQGVTAADHGLQGVT